MLRDQGSKKGTLKSTEEIMANGGCNVAQTIYENGQEWHPVLPSHGEQKCIKCRCKVSNILKLSNINLHLSDCCVVLHPRRIKKKFQRNLTEFVFFFIAGYKHNM